MKQLFVLGIMLLFFAGCKEEKAAVLQESSVQKEKIFGIPSECMEKIEQKDSVGYYDCCEKLNACWSPFDEDSFKKQAFFIRDTVKIVPLEDLRENIQKTRKIFKDFYSKPENQRKVDSICDVEKTNSKYVNFCKEYGGK